MSDSELMNHFQDYFQVTLAQTPDLIERIQRLRYEVYCREFHFEKDEDCPNKLEQDMYDPLSIHCLITHRATGVDAGCIRIVTPPASGVQTFVLPLERCCIQSITDTKWHPSYLPRDQIAEVSRLAVHTHFRRRRGESESPIGTKHFDSVSEKEQRTFPLLAVALFCAGCALMTIIKRGDAFIMTERSLARILRSLKCPCIQVGEIIEYHGSRAAYYVPMREVVETMQDEVKGLYSFIYQSLADGMEQNSTKTNNLA